jgi:hypothetical protein
MADITISTRHFCLIIAFMLVYFYLSDVFRTKEFKEAPRNLIQKDDKDTGHTFLDALENATNTVVGITSFTSIAIINKLSVRKINFCELFQL